MVDWVIVIIALLGAFFNAKRMRVGFLLWMISNIGLTTLNFRNGEPAQGFLFLCYLIISMYGYFSWNKNEPNPSK